MLRFGDGDSRLCLQTAHEILPTLSLKICDKESEKKQRCHASEHQPGGRWPVLSALRLLVLRTETGFQFRSQFFEDRGIAFEIGQGGALQNVYAIDRIIESCAQFSR